MAAKQQPPRAPSPNHPEQRKKSLPPKALSLNAKNIPNNQKRQKMLRTEILKNAVREMQSPAKQNAAENVTAIATAENPHVTFVTHQAFRCATSAEKRSNS